MEDLGMRARLQAAKRGRLRLPVDRERTLRAVETDPPDPEQVRCLTAWRNRYAASFLTEFEATEERTARWLRQTIGPDDTRILFMLEDGGRPAGYLGLAFIDWAARAGEADAIVRGEPLPRGTMRAALATLLGWARDELGLERLGVRVLADNPACEFYRRCGFVETGREGLVRRATADGAAWEPGAPAERWLIHFVLGATS